MSPIQRGCSMRCLDVEVVRRRIALHARRIAALAAKPSALLLLRHPGGVVLPFATHAPALELDALPDAATIGTPEYLRGRISMRTIVMNACCSAILRSHRAHRRQQRTLRPAFHPALTTLKPPALRLRVSRYAALARDSTKALRGLATKVGGPQTGQKAQLC